MARLRIYDASVPPSLRGWMLVSENFLPRFWATIWLDVINAGHANSTRAAKMAILDRFYLSAADQLGTDGLDAVIAGADFDTLEQLLGGFLVHLRNNSAIVNVDRETAWRTALKFIDDIMRHLGSTADAKMADIVSRCQRLERLYSQIAPSSPKPPPPIRALPAHVVEELYERFNPTSPQNPFRSTPQRWRNYLIFLILLHLGLRRGELLLLTVSPVEQDFDLDTQRQRYWINIVNNPYEDEDTRHSTPSIKTTASRRQLPVSRQIVGLIDTYSREYRGRAPHPFLLNSQQGKPLAAQSLALVFTIISGHLSDRSLKLLKQNGKSGVTAHDLRHTSAVARLARYRLAGSDLDTAIGKLRVFFGWSLTSSMPRHYGRAYFETALAEVWDERFDSYVKSLRNIEGREY